MAGLLQLIEGSAETAAGIALEFVPGAQGFGGMLASAGIGTMISGVGSMIAGEPVKGFATCTRNSIAPWKVVYGRIRSAGVLKTEWR
jgi:predicted phage tail protein